MTFFPDSNINPSFAEDWLDKNGYTVGKDFKSSVKELINPYKSINNRLKHNNQRLQQVTAKFKQGTLYGFYVEGVINNKLIGPDPIIHEKFLGDPTAFSFNYIIKQAFLITYIISDKLLDVISKFLKEKYHFKFQNKIYIPSNELIENVWERLINLDNLFFPQEYLNKYPKIRKNNNLYSLTYPHSEKLYNSWDFRITSTVTIDGYSDSYTIPYLRVYK
jgi:hypothetical protein